MISLAVAMFSTHNDATTFSRLFYLSEVMAPAVALVFLSYLCYVHRGRLTKPAKSWYYALAISVCALFFPLLGIATVDIANRFGISLTVYIIGVLCAMGLTLDSLSYFINSYRDE